MCRIRRLCQAVRVDFGFGKTAKTKASQTERTTRAISEQSQLFRIHLWQTKINVERFLSLNKQLHEKSMILAILETNLIRIFDFKYVKIYYYRNERI
jgi:hypothetical protein